MFIIIVGILGLVYLLYWVQKETRFNKLISSFPGSKGLPFFGNSLEWSIKPEEMFIIVRNYAKKYRETYRLTAGTLGSVNIINPEDAEIILSSPRQIKKSIIYRFLSVWLGTGLLTSDGKKWQQRRKILTPAFHFSILRRFVEIFNDHSDKLITQLRQESRNYKTNVVPLITQCALNTICETAMGTNLNSNGVRERRYCQSIYEMAKILVKRSLSPWYYNNFVFDHCPIGWKQRKHVNILHDFTERVIKERQENFQIEDVSDLDQEDDGITLKKRLAMLDLLIDAKNKSRIIDDLGIREEVDTFMFEGHDTTSMALCFALMVLANHKDVQDKILDELRTLFGTSKRQPSYNDLQNMKYLEMCLKECLRLYPSVPFISRELTEELALSSGIAPIGCMVNIHIYDIHRDPKVYPLPEKFDPERFSPEKAQGRHPFSYIPFSAGPRNCIGQKFAMLELKSIVSSILRNFILEPIDTAEDMQLQQDVVLRNKKAIYVKFIERP